MTGSTARSSRSPTCSATGSRPSSRTTSADRASTGPGGALRCGAPVGRIGPCLTTSPWVARATDRHHSLEATMDTARDNRPRRVLVVADWAADPQGVVSACLTQWQQPAVEFALVVPARLHGLDW